jgi:small subunit ribosomal protein SAe
MSAAKGVLALQEEDVTKILVANAHLGAANLNYQMEEYVFRRKNNGKNFLLLIFFSYQRINKQLN